MARVERFDISTYVRGPVGDNTAVTASTSWLIAKLPSEDRRGRLVSIDDKLDVVFVRSLWLNVGVEARCTTTESIVICIDATKVVPVVE